MDFTHIAATRENIEFCAANNIHLVVGTSGFVESDHAAIAKQFTGSNCLITSQTSRSVPCS
ncbi:MAG: hypothetical protein R2706_03960 [Acidimicrobiales bacterium]